uniref:Uncharacterized protein n=3 Tax=Chrysotila carterae TaxID=13221 RepID=A0A7S4BIS2_CHRCT|mmetsp:Transcript_16059/g.34467  ORF Transcript_16059/g.34467 Transcript_16059/m.34467 type:complete len:391 (+) Transcript_16059:184-1356(+)
MILLTIATGLPIRGLFVTTQSSSNIYMATNGGESTELPEKLLLQCAIQAQLSYYNEFKDELKARWLESFLGHDHLRVQRVSDHGGGRLLYQGIDNGLRCDWRGYVRTMLKAPPEEYSVSYKVGTADTAGMPQIPQTGADGAEPPWASASASRRNNPYLQKQEPQTREYQTILEPRRIARGLLSIRQQIADEWMKDISIIAAEGEYLRACHQDDVCSVEVDSFLTVNTTDVKVLEDPAAPLPPALMAASTQAFNSWNLPDSSPFRSANFDLLQRALTREAALAAMKSLARRGDEHAANAEFLRARLVRWSPRFEEPKRRQMAGLFLTELLHESPTIQRRDGKALFTDPSLVAAEVLEQRLRIATRWQEAVSQTADKQADVLREDLNEQNSV